MNLAAILEEAGFVPVVPAVSRDTGTAKTVVPQRVPVVPPVPAQESEPETETKPILARLLRIAARDGIAVHYVDALPAGALVGCGQHSDDTLGRWLHYRAASSDPSHVANCTCNTWIAQEET